jgi:hypothetical protein
MGYILINKFEMMTYKFKMINKNNEFFFLQKN